MYKEVLIMALSAITGLGGAGLLGATNVLNAQNSSSESQYTNDAVSDGGSAGGYFSRENGFSDSIYKAIADAYSESIAEQQSQSYNEDKTFGSEATAKDILLAEQQNRMQRQYMLDEMEYNRKEAETSREWQERMSNTAYQRAVKDLMAAGLNPILAVGNMGASTPIGATASSAMANAYRANVQADRSAYGTSSSYGYSKSKSESHSEAYSRSHAENHAEGGGWNKSWNHSEEHGQGTSGSNTTTQGSQLLKNLGKTITSVAGLMTGGSGKNGGGGGGFGGGNQGMLQSVKDAEKNTKDKNGKNGQSGGGGWR